MVPLLRRARWHGLRSLTDSGITAEFNGGTFWPGDYGDGTYPSGGEPYADVPPQTSQDVHYTTTYDVPWDWAHRFPPNVTPSDKPYVSSCPVETVRTTGRDGSEQTINVMRCY